MMRNDYRRALIMLRPHRPGYSGHVRLERRTLMGSMYFVISAPPSDAELCAALIRRDREGTYFSSKIGTLRRDGRGQASLAYTFDPRNIDGYALEDYILIAVVERGFENCNLVLTGNVNGSQEVSLNNVRIAACAACSEGRQPDCILCPPPGAGIPLPPPGGMTPVPPQRPPIDIPASPNEPPADNPGVQIPTVPPIDIPASPDEPPENDPGVQIPALPGPESEIPPQPPTPIQPRGQTAAEAMGADVSQPWSGMAEQVRRLFAERPVQELMLNDGHTYVRAEMPEGSGYDHVNVGVRMQDGKPVSVAYALPGHFSPEPPPGMDGYHWQGGAAEGWWVIRTDAETGAALV